MVSAPKAPDPYKTAQAQSVFNQNTAMTQQAMNMVDQQTPWGSLSHQQTGTQTIIGADGKPLTVPQYTATTTLSPEQQAIFGESQAAQANLAGLASEQSSFMRDYLGEPFQFDNQDAADWAYDLGSSRLDPRFAQAREAERSRLLNSGIREGSAAWDAAMGRVGQDENDAYNQLMLQGRGQAFQEALAGRNQPINELSALMSGSQVSMPNFINTPQTGVGGVDYTGLVNQKYQSEMESYQAGMGGLFGLGGALIKAIPWSDARLKENIRRVGKTDGGAPIYTYTYRDDPGHVTYMGVMAQDVPEARVMDPSGFYRVDYSKVN